MEKKTPKPMTPFDELTTPSELRVLKLLLPYIPISGQQSIWILIKFMELQYTIQFFSHPENLLHTQAFQHFPASPLEILDEISPYLLPEEAEMLDTFRNVMNIMEMVQMFQNSSDFSGDDFSGFSMDNSENNSENDSKNTSPGKQNSPLNFGGMNPINLMMGMLSPEQQEMFQMYQSMFSDFDADISGTDSPASDTFGGSGSDTGTTFHKNRNSEIQNHSEKKDIDNVVSDTIDPDIQHFESEA